MNAVIAIMSRLREALMPRGVFGRIDVDLCMSLLDEMEAQLPLVVRQADAIVAKKSDVLARAEQHAQEILHQADKRAEKLVSESAVLQRAREEAERYAKEQAAAGRAVLSDLAAYLEAVAKDMKAHGGKLKEKNTQKGNYYVQRHKTY